MDDSVSATTLITTSTIFPGPQPCSLRFLSLLDADISSQKCCGVEVADTEKLLRATDTTYEKRNLEGARIPGTHER